MNVPTHITRAQLIAACEALGFEPKATPGFNLQLLVGTGEVMVIQYLLDENGRQFLVGDRPAMNTYRIPVAETAVKPACSCGHPQIEHVWALYDCANSGCTCDGFTAQSTEEAA